MTDNNTLYLNSLSNPKLVQLLQDGAVGLIPTDTVYGVACSATIEGAVDKLSKIKGRETKKGVLIAANIEQLEKLGFKRRYLKAVEEYWPGPVSIVIPCSNLVNNLDLNTGFLGVRIPDDNNLLELLNKVGPILTSSANKTGQNPVTSVDGAKSAFGDSLDFYVDGGDFTGREPSALIQIIDDAVDVIRPGYNFKK